MADVFGTDDYQNPFLFYKDEYDDRVWQRRRRSNLLEKRKQMDGYEILEVINRGSFGVVYRARDKRSEEIVAVKEEMDGLSPSTLVEIDILKSLPRHPSIVAFKEAVAEGARVYVVMEYLKYDLKRVRAAVGRPFSLVEIKFLMAEILKGVGFLHGRGVMHRDLKPANILLGEGYKVKICDFGLSARLGSDRASCGRGVGTRWYKAPEVLAGAHRYTSAVDMWGVGCIMAELVLDEAPFRGRSDAHQLACIRYVLCDRSNHLRLKMESAASFSGATRLTQSGHDLLGGLLAYDPSKRISAADALNHPWFKEQVIQ